jgi:antirestriction protein ArdC
MPVQRHDVITERVVQALIDGQIPWRNDYGQPSNIVNRQPYKGVNALLLNISTKKNGFKSNWWGTWSQWKAQGLEIKPRPDNVPQGSWGTEVVVKEKDHRLRRWVVYNLDQVDGGFDVLRAVKHTPKYEKADSLILCTEADIEYKAGDEAAYYYPPLDKVVFPLKEQFEEGPGGLAGYYNSIFHELAHWTETRLLWSGSEEEKELRAEIAADFLTTTLRLPGLQYEVRNNHHDFLERWVKMLCEEPPLLYRLAEDANVAADFILATEGAANVQTQQGTTQG